MPLKANDWPTSGQGVEEIVALREKSNRLDYPQVQGFSLVHSHGSHLQFSHSQSGLLHLLDSSLIGAQHTLPFRPEQVLQTGCWQAK